MNFFAASKLSNGPSANICAQSTSEVLYAQQPSFRRKSMTRFSINALIGGILRVRSPITYTFVPTYTSSHFISATFLSGKTQSCWTWTSSFRICSSFYPFSFAVTSLLKMCRSFGSHDIHSILGYVACLFSMVTYACVVLHASLFKRKTLHACCHWVPHSTMRRWASHWQNPSKDQDP